MFERLKKLFGIKTKAKPLQTSQGQNIPPTKPTPIPFTLDLAEMQAAALSKLNRQDKKLSVNIGIEISFETLILTLTSVDDAAELVTFTFPALFTDAQKNCLNVGGGDFTSINPFSLLWGVEPTTCEKDDSALHVDFYFNPGSLGIDAAREIISGVLAEIHDPATLPTGSHAATAHSVGLDTVLKSHNAAVETFLPVLAPTRVSVPKAVNAIAAFVYYVKEYRAKLGISDDVDVTDALYASETESTVLAKVHATNICVSLSSGGPNRSRVSEGGDASEWGPPTAARALQARA